MNGRGAYVCAAADCIEQARKQKRLERALRLENMPSTLFEQLLHAAEEMALQQSLPETREGE